MYQVHKLSSEIILKLVSLLHMEDLKEESIDHKGFKYFATNGVLDNKTYRMIWLLPPDNSYIGVRTAYRRNKNGK